MVSADRMELGAKAKKNDDIPVWEALDYGNDVPYTKLARYTLSPVGAAVAGSSSSNGWSYKVEELSQRSTDFASVNPAMSCKKVRFLIII